MRWRGVIALGLLGLAGCGLADYEARMLEAQRRQQRFDDEARLLDKPVNVPTRDEKGVAVPVTALFFRPPRGISDTPAPAPRDQFALYYPRTAGGAGVFQRVELAFGAGQKEFGQAVFATFQPTEKVALTSRRAGDGGREVTIESAEFDDRTGDRVALYVVHPPAADPRGTPVAVAYRFARGAQAQAKPLIDVSLGTLAEGASAGPARGAYQRGSPWGGGR